MKNIMSQHKITLIGLISVSVLWGCNYIASAVLLRGFSPIFLSTIRICFTSLFLISLVLFHKGIRKPTKKEWKYLAGVGILGTLFNQCFYFVGLHHSTAAKASLIFAMAPIATLIMERIFFKVRLSANKSIGAGISLVGVLSIVGITGGSIGMTFGDLDLVVAMLCLASSILFIRGLTETMDSYSVTIYSTVFGSLLMIPAMGVESTIGLTVISHAWYMWVLLALAGILSQGVAGFWWNRGVAEVGAGTASLFMNIQPFVAIVMSHFLLGDKIMANQIVGGLLVLAGVFIATRTIHPRPISGPGAVAPL